MLASLGSKGKNRNPLTCLKKAGSYSGVSYCNLPSLFRVSGRLECARHSRKTYGTVVWVVLTGSLECLLLLLPGGKGDLILRDRILSNRGHVACVVCYPRVETASSSGSHRTVVWVVLRGSTIKYLIFVLFIITHLVSTSPEPICRSNSRISRKV